MAKPSTKPEKTETTLVQQAKSFTTRSSRVPAPGVSDLANAFLRGEVSLSACAGAMKTSSNVAAYRMLVALAYETQVAMKRN